jgi:hypothetical protein
MSHPCSQNRIELTCLTPIAKPNRAHRSHPYSQTNQTQYPTRPKPTIPQLIVWKVHAAHDREHDYHDSLYSTEVAKLYPQLGDSITHRWLRVSILPNVHFLSCTVRRSPHSLSHRFSACKTSTLRFHRCRLHHPTEAPSCAKVRITPSIT